MVFVLGTVGGGGPTPVTLALAGLAVSAFLDALTSAVVLADNATLNEYRFWAVGSVAGRGTDVVLQILPFIIAGLVLAVINAPALNLLGLGEDVANGLGLNLRAARWTVWWPLRC